MKRENGLTRRKFLHLAGTGAAGAFFLAACAQPTPTSAPQPTQAPAKATTAPTAPPATQAPKATAVPTARAPLTLRVWGPWASTIPLVKGYQTVFDDYDKKSGDKTEYVYVATTAGAAPAEKLLTAIAGGDPPDVAFHDRFLVASWAARASLVELTPLAERDGVKKDDFLSYCWEEANYCGRLYGLPTNTAARALYYNVTLFKEANLDPTKPPKTWSDLDTMQDALTQGNSKDGYKRLGHIPWYPWLDWAIYLWAMTGEGVEPWDAAKRKCTVNTEPFLQTADWLSKYAKKYDVAAMDGFGSQFGGAAQDPFGNGLICMIQNTNAALLTYNQYFPNLDYQVALLPGPAKATGRNLAGGWSVVLPKGVKHPEASWALINYFAGEQAQFKMYRDNPEEILSSNIPTRVKVAKDPQAAYVRHPKAKPFMQAIDVQYIRPTIPEGQLLFEELGKASDLIVHMRVDAKQALDAVAAKVDEAMAKWKC